MVKWAMVAAAWLVCAVAHGQSHGVVGEWREPGGSVIEIYNCGPDICAKLVAIRTSAPMFVDGHNPDETLRTRPLCGLVIGTGFQAQGEDRAEEGKLYDPKSGRLYSGAMAVVDGKLKVRGY